MRESKSVRVNVSIHVPLREQMCVGVLLGRILTHSDCFICKRACCQPASAFVCP